MNTFAFCKYFPGNSVVHRLDSRLKIISSALFFALAFSSNNIFSLILIAAFVIIMAIFSCVPIIKYIKSFNIIKIYFTVSYYAGEKQAKHMAKCKVT